MIVKDDIKVVDNNASPNIIIIDDDVKFAKSLAKVISATDVNNNILVAATPEEAAHLVSQHKPLVAILDLCLKEEEGTSSGLSLLKTLIQIDSTMRVIVLTGHSSDDIGIIALKAGAANFLSKPPNIDHLSVLIKDGIYQAKLSRRYREQARKNFDAHFVGESEAIKAIRKDIEYLANINCSVLITGETGTGKNVCAHLIHILGNIEGPFVRYQPTFTSGDLINSDLFGHVEGSFTGAIGDRCGIIARANGGTLFLDEVCELPLQTQVLLLEALQEKVIRPVGGDTEKKVDFRLISATNCKTEEALSSGKLRKDFYHRICEYTLTIPPLRDRRDDIRLLATFFKEKTVSKEGLYDIKLSHELIAMLESYDWPGNVRELKSVIEFAVMRANFCQSDVVRPEHLPRPLQRNNPRSETHSLVNGKTMEEMVIAFKKQVAKEALKQAGGNRTKAAKLLGINRATLRKLVEDITFQAK